MELIAVTLNAPSSRYAYDDTAALLDYGFNNFSSKMLSTDKVYLDESKNRYKIETPMIVTIPKNEEISENIRGNSLILIGEDGSVIFEQELRKLADPSEKQETKQSSLNEVKTNEHDLWIWKILHFFNLCNFTRP